MVALEHTAIVGMARTPFGKFGGALKDCSAVTLGGIAIGEAVHRANISPTLVDYVYMGQVLSAGCGQIPARQAARQAGLPWETVALNINKVCSSGMSAIAIADMQIRLNKANIIVAGGMESMSNVPYALTKQRWGARMGDVGAVDLMLYDGLWCAFYDQHMAVHGSTVSREYAISREAQDEWAVRSQQRTGKAMASGLLREEIVPVEIQERHKSRIIDCDEAPRPDTTMEALAKLRPIYLEGGTVTPGNAPGVNDGAAALVLVGEERARKMGLPVLATILGHEEVSQEAQYIATVPALATQKLLEKQGLSVKDIHIIEANEAFAAVSLVSAKIGGWDIEKVNVDGGAIALGHPLGASGARIVMHTVQALRRRGGGLGVACICSGAAQGNAMLLKVE